MWLQCEMAKKKQMNYAILALNCTNTGLSVLAKKIHDNETNIYIFFKFA